MSTASADAYAVAACDIEVGTLERDWEWIIVHHSATEAGTVAAIDANHRQRVDSEGNPWRGIGYHFVIGNGRGIPDGQIEPTFRWKQQLAGAHAGSLTHNDVGVGICLIGNFEEEVPTDAQQKALKGLVSRLAESYDIAGENLLGHRSVRATACPGRMFPAELLTLPQGDPPPSESPAASLRKDSK